VTSSTWWIALHQDKRSLHELSFQVSWSQASHSTLNQWLRKKRVWIQLTQFCSQNDHLKKLWTRTSLRSTPIRERKTSKKWLAFCLKKSRATSANCLKSHENWTLGRSTRASLKCSLQKSCAASTWTSWQSLWSNQGRPSCGRNWWRPAKYTVLSTTRGRTGLWSTPTTCNTLWVRSLCRLKPLQSLTN